MLRRLLVLVLLAWLPLQSVAAPAFMVLCELGHDAPLMSVHGSGHGPSHQHDAASGDGEGDGDTGHAPHGCCHHLYTGTAARILPIAQDGVARYAAAADTPAPSFIADALERPPRAVLA